MTVRKWVNLAVSAAQTWWGNLTFNVFGGRLDPKTSDFEASWCPVELGFWFSLFQVSVYSSSLHPDLSTYWSTSLVMMVVHSDVFKMSITVQRFKHSVGVDQSWFQTHTTTRSFSSAFRKQLKHVSVLNTGRSKPLVEPDILMLTPPRFHMESQDYTRYWITATRQSNLWL